MKKKPAQCPRQGKSNANIKSFLNNLRENDLHFEDNHITQCVFLGVLRLKPVPSVFASNKVPCVVVDNKSKRYRNNNSVKEINKNLSQKNDINKVISGKIRKKNPDNIKASVKKLYTKKPVIKIKLNINKNKKDNMFQSKKNTLNPTTPVFNPVQNLIDKLKQQMDGKYTSDSSDLNKETLFSSELNAKNSKKIKRTNKKVPSQEKGSFSDTKSSDDVIVIDEDNGSDCEEVLITTDSIPDFASPNTEKGNKNDVILIEDASEGSPPNLMVTDDSRSTRISPRLHKGDSSNKSVDSTESNASNLEDKSSNEEISSKEKPRKRRTLLPAIPSIFFNAPMLLRSELAQKKSETRPVLQKAHTADKKQDKSQPKQRKESKPRNSTGNLIYEVVKSSSEQNVSQISNEGQNDVVLVDRSPPKVEPLIIKLKVSQNKAANDEDKEKNGKIQKTKVTKNLFFPRLLRSDVNETKDNKITSEKPSEPPFYGKLSVKPDSFLKESPEKLTQPETSFHSSPNEKTPPIANKKTEKPSETPRRLLRSDIAQEKTIITIEDNSLESPNQNSSQEKCPTDPPIYQRQPGSVEPPGGAPKRSEECVIETPIPERTAAVVFGPTATSGEPPRLLRSVAAQKQPDDPAATRDIIDVDAPEVEKENVTVSGGVINVDLTGEDPKVADEPADGAPKGKMSSRDVPRRQLRSNLASVDQTSSEDSRKESEICEAKSISTKKKTVKSIAKRLDIDLVDYEDLSVDTSTPRQLRSEIASKKNDDNGAEIKKNDTKADEKIWIEENKHRTRSVSKSRSLVVETVTKIEKNPRNRSVSNTRLSVRKEAKKDENLTGKLSGIDQKARGRSLCRKSVQVSGESVAKMRVSKSLGAAPKEKSAVIDIEDEKDVSEIVKNTAKTKPQKTALISLKNNMKKGGIVGKVNENKKSKPKSAARVEKNPQTMKIVDATKQAANKKPGERNSPANKRSTKRIEKIQRKSKIDIKIPRSLRSNADTTAQNVEIKSEITTTSNKHTKSPKKSASPAAEKKPAKPTESTTRILRSSFPQANVKAEPAEAPALTTEKVVVLIHSEPNPKRSEDAPKEHRDQKPKPRILRSQNLNEIEVVKEEPLRRKKAAKKCGVSRKSKVISKKKKEKVDGKLKTKIKKAAKTEELKSSKRASKKATPRKVKPKIKSSAKRKGILNWQNDEIIERIIQELKNTIFNHDSTEETKTKERNKPQKKSYGAKNNRKMIQLARKKILQTKAALQRKLRSAKRESPAANTSSSSESKENNPTRANIPKTATETPKPIKEETVIQAVDSYLMETNTNDSIIILNEVTVQTNGKVVEKSLKRRGAESADVGAGKEQYKSSPTETAQFPGENSADADVKTHDITVFDFEESEPEVAPLRHKAAPKDSHVGHAAPEKNNAREDLDAFEQSTSKTVERNDRPKRKSKLLVPMFDEEGNPRKLWSVIDKPKPPSPDSSKLWSVISDSKSPANPPQSKRPKTLEIPAATASTSADKPLEPASPDSGKKSPLKQPTIIEMFSKVWMKQEKPSAAKNLSNEDGSVFGNMPPPENQDAASAPSPGRERIEDYDSDTESRAEWIPEEYAEYKFKYSAQKMMQYKPVFKCKICLVVFPSYYKLIKHRTEHEKQEKPYCCPQCGCEFKEVQDFSAHLRVHKGKHPYTCQKCDMGFWTKKAYEAHAPVHILRKAKPPVKKFRCDVCSKEFSKLCDVERHTRVHTGEKPCICNICNKRFQQAHNLSKHLLTHLHLKPFVCEICNKQFGRSDVLRRHLLTHSVDKPVKCSICSRGFIRHSQLLQHHNKKHPDQMIAELAENAEKEMNGGFKNE